MSAPAPRALDGSALAALVILALICLMSAFAPVTELSAYVIFGLGLLLVALAAIGMFR